MYDNSDKEGNENIVYWVIKELINYFRKGEQK